MTETVTTARLLLRRWRPEDEPDLAAINSDPEVTRLLNRPLDRAGVDAFLGSLTAHWEEHGFGPWALESREPEHRGELLGFAGLAMIPGYLAAAGSGPELGWRLRRSAWGRGLATEASAAARDHAFDRLGLPEIVSIIHPGNDRSRRVAAKLGMRLVRQVDNPAIGRQVDVWWCSAPAHSTAEAD